MNPADLPAAFGGPGWSPRTRRMREEIGDRALSLVTDGRRCTRRS